MTLVIATRNSHKVGEIREILGGKFHYLTLTDFPAAPHVVEDAGSFGGNATKKAVELARWLSENAVRLKPPQREPMFVLADDSGLEVDALNGAPGVYSARFAALENGKRGNSPDAENNARLLQMLQTVPLEKRTARFRCVIALSPVIEMDVANASPVCSANEAELQTRLFEGACEGRIEFAPRGRGGFGYDPLFIPTGFEQSFAELGEKQKNEISHRSRALAKLRAALSK